MSTNSIKILVNNKTINFSQADFPILISGRDGSGASLFSVSMLANVLKNGEKVLFFSAQAPAKEEFKKQIGDSLNDKVVIIKSGDENLFLEKIDQIQDLSERIILFKNIENYSPKLFNKLKNQKLIIFSGDLDKCQFNTQLIEKDFKTKIFFSYPQKIQVKNKIDLPKYHGLIFSKKYNGLISVSK